MLVGPRPAVSSIFSASLRIRMALISVSFGSLRVEQNLGIYSEGEDGATLSFNALATSLYVLPISFLPVLEWIPTSSRVLGMFPILQRA